MLFLGVFSLSIEDLLLLFCIISLLKKDSKNLDKKLLAYYKKTERPVLDCLKKYEVTLKILSL